ncbi:hypothetical protein ASG60_13805 [Methylobacterium sp. Leaf469]|nr:hypothetical protein ASG60_13805 [Methylobacterium sp. Leaf469]
MPGSIEANPARLDLTAELIALRTGVSRSVLYRMFEPLGGVATRVRHRRLHPMRRALSRGDDVRSIREVAWTTGFTSASHANRSFREAFGMTPGKFRLCIVVAGAGPARDASPKASFKRWFVEVRSSVSAKADRMFGMYRDQNGPLRQRHTIAAFPTDP